MTCEAAFTMRSLCKLKGDESHPSRGLGSNVQKTRT